MMKLKTNNKNRNGKQFLLLLILLLSVKSIFAQEIKAIEVADNTFKINGNQEETFYYGFAKGDKILFSYHEKNGKELKEIEIRELPSTTKFMDYKTSSIAQKEIEINTTGIYKFRFVNSAKIGRVCNFKLLRIPADESTKNFNTSVVWEANNDTVYYSVEEKYLISRDTVIHNITDQVSKVHSSTNSNGNRTSFNFTLPPKTVAWSYYVGVDQAGQEALEKATRDLSKTAGKILLKLPGYGPLAAVALGSTSYITQLQSGEDIDYYIVTSENYKLFSTKKKFSYLKKGKVINDFSQMTKPLTGTMYFCLLNDNAVTGVTVIVKVTAISVTENWGKRTVQKFKVNSEKVPKLKPDH